MVAERAIDRRSVRDVVRIESRVRRSEERHAWTTVRRHAGHIHLATVAERPDIALHAAGAIVSLADRRLRQLGGFDDAA